MSNISTKEDLNIKEKSIKIKVNDLTLSDEQSLPIINNDKVSLIIAGAGSGKTLTIVGKIKYMLDNNLINKEEICAITYTNKATISMKGKIYEATNENIDTFTFHKLALKVLDTANISYNILSEDLLNDVIDNFFNIDIYCNKILMKSIYNYFGYYIFKTKKNYKKILKSKEFSKFKELIKTFISYMNANNLSSKWKSLLQNKKYYKPLLIIYAIYNSYLNEIYSSNNIDFDSMISKATDILESKSIKLPYKLIIVDEFQDTSYLRFKLIKALVNLNDSSLCVVGDDYQSIYRFQGCDLNIFLNFQKYYKNSKVYYLNETYRNSQEIIDIAGSFIQKNKYQIKKNLVSKKRLNHPIKIKYTTNLVKLIKELPIDKEILILGRNNFDIKKYLKEYKLIDNILYIKGIKHNLKYLTIHSSKGLESDIVIVLNCIDNIYGIPSKLKDDKLIDLLKGKEEYIYAEERRLFYVAITRTKSYTYILTEKGKESIFIKELKKM